MAKYIYHFKNEEDFSSRRNGNYYEPWVSLTEPSKRVDYNKTKEEKMPGTRLSFEILSGGTIAWDNNQSGFYSDYNPYYLKYRINGGEWGTLVNNVHDEPETSVSAFTVNAGDVVEIEANNNGYSWGLVQTYDGHFSFNFSQDMKLNVYGNIMSLIYPEGEFETATEFPYNEYERTDWFAGLFSTIHGGSASALVDAGYLLLPATTLVSSCYTGMFQGCTSLTTAPELPATTLVDNCYVNMFSGCSSLNRIKAMFTTTPSATYTENWVSGVAPNGTFVKNAAATWSETGVNGIPAGWTVVTE